MFIRSKLKQDSLFGEAYRHDPTRAEFYWATGGDCDAHPIQHRAWLQRRAAQHKERK